MIRLEPRLRFAYFALNELSLLSVKVTELKFVLRSLSYHGFFFNNDSKIGFLFKNLKYTLLRKLVEIFLARYIMLYAYLCFSIGNCAFNLYFFQ